jgi:hypothetical protein
MMTISSVGSAYTFLSTFSARRIFKVRDVIDEFDPEIERLQSVWSAEVIRLSEESLTGEHSRTQAEQRAIVAAMPECIEHNRLAKLQRPHLDA